MQNSKETKIWNATLYLRLSRDDGDKEESNSIIGQRELLRNFIRTRPELREYAVRIDDGFTGSNFERPSFKKMLEDVKAGRTNCIIVKDLSRFGRNYKETGNYLERIFPFLGVRFIAVNDGFDTLTAQRGMDGYLVPLKNLINEVYSKDISRKSGSALAAKQKNGDFIGAWAPYGYRKCPDDPHKLEPDEATAPVVRQIFRWRAEGIGVTQIARRLNDGGVPSPSAYLYKTGACKTEKYNGVIWYVQTVKNILSRQVYIGHMVQGTKRQSFYENRGQYMKPREDWIVVENTHEPLIDRETFDKVQELAQRKKTEYFDNLGRFTHLKTTENILKGLVYCADCKRPLVRYKNVSHEKKLWYTFICQTHTNDITSCPKKNIREDVLIPLLLQAIQTQIALAADMEALIRRVNSSPKYRMQIATLQGKLDAAKKALMRYNGLYDSLYQNYVDKLMTEQEYMTLKHRYKAEAEEAERLIEALTCQQAAEAAHTPENPFLTAFGSFRDADTLTREMAQALIQRVYVDGGSNIEIVFRYRDEYKELCTYLEGRQRLNTSFDCSEDRIPEADILEVVIDTIQVYAQYAVSIDRLLQTRQAQRVLDRKQAQRRLQTLQSQKAQLDERLQDLYERLVEGEISRESFAAQKKALTAQAEEITRTVLELERKISGSDDNSNAVIEQFKSYAGITALTREISAELLQSVTIYPDGRMDIRLNLADEIKALMETLHREFCTA